MNNFSLIELLPSQTLNLHAKTHMQLSICHGQAWLTRSSDFNHRGMEDEFPDVGDKLLISAGERLVIESLSRHEPLRLQWLAQARPAVWRRLKLAVLAFISQLARRVKRHSVL